ncbi:disease resistance protein (TIR-NBS-LRR class) [Artemisia annua]|uniref:Disease resistance protein (TIR-NBS-LRR class) n=1 Tax=Artemisia annua TaxID=35608 RepID=A0A2U1PSS4_ARTAN|nr:disease resistance protein (TIR-NBS-LRR class) [Artemisia annua]
MVSTSSSSNQKSFKYDMFLSFRGEDTRNCFIGHLYQALKQKGIETYKDDEKIKKGERINDQLLKSIEESRFFIIVFSKTYASSSWCLDELIKIMECKKTTEPNVYPVFIDVKPTDVRNQSGPVEKAFAENAKKGAAGKWREAMKEASNLAGWELKATANVDESELIQLIVDVIFKKLHSANSSAYGKLVGMETRISDVLSSLEIGSEDVRMIGIKGIGGGGKTTLARAVYDQISNKFEGKSFVENVREVSKASLSGLKKLQKQILRDVFYDKKISISGVLDGKSTMIQMMCRKRVLVVLDDVDHSDQLEALVGDLDYFKSGSRIIITTRDEQVLVSHRVSLICNVNLLTDDEAMCLFRRYTFGKKIPTQGYNEMSVMSRQYNEMSEQVVRYAAGLPLTIKVLGSFLHGKNELEWKDALERLNTIPQKDTQEMLKISYDALEPDLKEIFLDVACILKGEQKDKALRVLESCGFHATIGLSVLEKRSLINISEYGSLGMHDRIEEMGKNIDGHLHFNEHNRHSRMWIEKEIEDTLANNLGFQVNEAIRCIKLSPQRLDLRTFMTGLRNMKKLRVLYMCSGSDWDDSKVSQLFPSSLKYLCWRAYPFSSLHETFQADNLVGLDMSFSSILQLWLVGKGKALTKLRFLDLSHTRLRKLNLGLTPNLERLDLTDCWNLVEINAPVGCLKNLLYLDLSGSGRFKSFLFDKQSNSLKVGSSSEFHLIVESVDKSALHMDNNLRNYKFTCFYKEDPAASSFGNLEKLISIGFCSSTNLESFSRSIFGLQCLKKLTLVGSIPEVSKDVHQLQCLEELSFSEREIENFPDSVCMLGQLKSLKLNSCWNLKKLPDDISQLESLQEFCLSDANIKHLPDGLCMLKQLKSLKLEYCRGLKSLPEDFGELESLEKLMLSSTDISCLPDSICKLKHLKYLEIEWLSRNQKLLEDLGRLQCLEKLILRWCYFSGGFPKSIFELIKRLKYFHLLDCTLDDLPEELGHLKSLEELDITGTDISHLPQSIFQLKGLRIIGFKRTLELCGLTPVKRTSDNGAYEMFCYTVV